jgi:hypothetical protein
MVNSFFETDQVQAGFCKTLGVVVRMLFAFA